MRTPWNNYLLYFIRGVLSPFFLKCWIQAGICQCLKCQKVLIVFIHAWICWRVVWIRWTEVWYVRFFFPPRTMRSLKFFWFVLVYGSAHEVCFRNGIWICFFFVGNVSLNSIIIYPCWYWWWIWQGFMHKWSEVDQDLRKASLSLSWDFFQR